MMTTGVVVTVVDDDESVRQAVMRLLKSYGLSVKDFASAEDFLSDTHAGDSACLILDVRLPGMTGLELQRRLVTSDCRVPIVFISAHDDGSARTLALESGAIDFLEKPFNEDELFGAIAASLVIHRNGAFNYPDQGLSI